MSMLRSNQLSYGREHASADMHSSSAYERVILILPYGVAV